MMFDSIVKHPYKAKIDKMFFEDESPANVASWVRNTVDEDETIPLDRKIDYYLGESRLAKYKKFLKDEASKALAVVSTKEGVREVVFDSAQVTSSLVRKDIQKNIIDLNTTFLNLFDKVQERLERMEEKAEFIDNPYHEKVIQGYVQELRNLLKDYSRISGLENFYQKIGEAAGTQKVKTIMSEKVKDAMKQLIRDVLAEVSPSKIPIILERFEKILEQGAEEDAIRGSQETQNTTTINLP